MHLLLSVSKFFFASDLNLYFAFINLQSNSHYPHAKRGI